jgi:acyl-CoA synthetase (AMP-forming)/AMP-acid ligase II
MQLAGHQMLPLEPREVPPGILDINGHTEMSCFSSIAEILRHRALNTARTVAFTTLDPKGKEVASLTWEKVNARAEKVAHLIRQKSGLNLGDRAALIYRKSEILDFIVALLGCFLAGVVAVPINAAEEMAELSFILSSTNVYLALTTDYNLRAFTKDLQSRQQEFPPNIEWWKTNEFGSWYPKSKGGSDYPEITLPDLAYIEYSKAPNGELKGVAISHRTIMAQCTAYKASVSPNETQGNGRASSNGPDTVVTYLEPRQQVGLIVGILCSVFSGNSTVFVSSTVMDSAAIWVNILTRYRATIAVADYAALQGVTRQFSINRAEVINYNKKQPADLSSMRLLLIDTTIVDSEIDIHIAENLLLPLGVEDPLQVVCPMASLPEHGGMILSLRDYLGPAKLEEVVANDAPEKDGQNMSIRWITADGSSRDYWECLLDREAFKDNRILVLATGADVQEQLATSKAVVATAFGFAMPEGL